jgi:hypothetical protein
MIIIITIKVLMWLVASYFGIITFVIISIVIALITNFQNSNMKFQTQISFLKTQIIFFRNQI